MAAIHFKPHVIPLSNVNSSNSNIAGFFSFSFLLMDVIIKPPACLCFHSCECERGRGRESVACHEAVSPVNMEKTTQTYMIYHSWVKEPRAR